MLKIAEQLGKSGSPYLIRWVIGHPKIGSIRLHKWVGSDDLRAYHDHAWWYITFILYGSYYDESPNKRVLLKRFHVRYFSAKHQHSVNPIQFPTWTILITGPEKRKWGFYVNGKFRKRNKYFFEHGHH